MAGNIAKNQKLMENIAKEKGIQDPFLLDQEIISNLKKKKDPSPRNP
jgi:hypothetical protein